MKEKRIKTIILTAMVIIAIAGVFMPEITSFITPICLTALGYIVYKKEVKVDVNLDDDTIVRMATIGERNSKVYIEKKELEYRLDNLDKFIRSKKFSSLDPLRQRMLMEQSGVMSEYLNLLNRLYK